MYLQQPSSENMSAHRKNGKYRTSWDGQRRGHGRRSKAASEPGLLANMQLHPLAFIGSVAGLLGVLMLKVLFTRGRR
jgi:hypothetical protein